MDTVALNCAASNLADYLSWLERTWAEVRRLFALWRWSVDDLEAFWLSIVAFYSSRCADRRAAPTVRGDAGARWFEGAEINYAEAAFRCCYSG